MYRISLQTLEDNNYNDQQAPKENCDNLCYLFEVKRQFVYLKLLNVLKYAKNDNKDLNFVNFSYPSSFMLLIKINLPKKTINS